MNEISPQYLRENISLVPRNIQLFSKSIYENVAMVKPNAIESEVVRALTVVDAQVFIKKKPMQACTYLAGKSVPIRCNRQSGEFY